MMPIWCSWKGLSDPNWILNCRREEAIGIEYPKWRIFKISLRQQLSTSWLHWGSLWRLLCCGFNPSTIESTSRNGTEKGSEGARRAPGLSSRSLSTWMPKPTSSFWIGCLQHWGCLSLSSSTMRALIPLRIFGFMYLGKLSSFMNHDDCVKRSTIITLLLVTCLVNDSLSVAAWRYSSQ